MTSSGISSGSSNANGSIGTNAETLAIHLHSREIEVRSVVSRRHIATFNEQGGSSMLAQGQRGDPVPTSKESITNS